MLEKLVIVPKKRTIGMKILNIAVFVLTCILFLGAMAAPGLLMILAIGSAVLWYFLTFCANMEYEYTYYDGELRFARIRNKSRRKELESVQLEDVLILAPRGDRSVYKYEKDDSLNYKNYTSRRDGVSVYELVFKNQKGCSRYEFEPDEEMLDAILVKYPRLVIK